jgi:hypothetical protein
MRVVLSLLVLFLAMAFASTAAANPARANLDLQDFDGRYTRVDGDHLTIIPLHGAEYVDKAYIAGMFTEKHGSCHFAAMGNWHYNTKMFTINAGDGCHLQLAVDAQAFRFSEGPSGRCSQRLCAGALSWDMVRMGRNTNGATSSPAPVHEKTTHVVPATPAAVVHEKTSHELRVEVMQTTEYKGFWESLGSAVGSVLDFLAPVARIERTTTVRRYSLNSMDEEKAATHPSELKKRGKSVHVEVEIDA